MTGSKALIRDEEVLHSIGPSNEALCARSGKTSDIRPYINTIELRSND